MSTFDAAFLAGAAPPLLSHHGESVTYHPQGIGAETRTIDAVIHRDPFGTVNESPGGVVAPHALIEVYDDTETGIAVSEFTHGDKIEYRVLTDGSGSTSSRTIARIVSVVGGLVTYEVR